MGWLRWSEPFYFFYLVFGTVALSICVEVCGRLADVFAACFRRSRFDKVTREWKVVLCFMPSLWLWTLM